MAGRLEMARDCPPQLLGSGQERQTVQGVAVWRLSRRQDWPRRVKLCLQEAANFPASLSRSSNGHPETRLRSLLSFNFNVLTLLFKKNSSFSRWRLSVDRSWMEAHENGQTQRGNVAPKW